MLARYRLETTPFLLGSWTWFRNHVAVAWHGIYSRRCHPGHSRDTYRFQTMPSISILCFPPQRLARNCADGRLKCIAPPSLRRCRWPLPNLFVGPASQWAAICRTTAELGDFAMGETFHDPWRTSVLQLSGN